VDEAARSAALGQELAEARSALAALQQEFDDLTLLYEATIEHGEAVEDQLAEKNILLQATQARLEAELEEAAQYIRSLLPAPRSQTPRTEWLLEPSNELGGDSFGYHELDADHLAIYLLDVCGHGVGAALLSITAINVLRSGALSATDFRDPAAVLTALDTAFQMEDQNQMYFSIWYGVYRRSTSRLAYASAGHPPAILLRAGAEPGGVERLMTANLAPGTFPGFDFEAAEVPIHPGDRLLILSDGTYEVTDDAGRSLTFAHLAEFVATPGCDTPARIYERVRQLHGTGPLPDDFSLLRVEF
jgi:serine phosphatase RsbU (regulator of sigma subunit)